MTMRRVIQVAAAFILNPFIPNFIRGTIYQGTLKHICVPGLNCYSCPAAFGACPIGALQVTLSSVRGWFSGAVAAATALASLYVAGVILLVGTLAGRFACGWLCPFGFLQDLFYSRGRRRIPLPGWALYAKYVFLAVFVVGLPLFVAYPASPAFCKWICPAGTLEAGAPLVLVDEIAGRGQFVLGFLFVWKISVAFVFLCGVLLISRFFCRTACPLGAIWGILNRVSLLAVRVDQKACTKCGFCRSVCPVDISIYENSDSPECIRCFKCLKCPEGAVTVGLRGSMADLADETHSAGAE